MQYFKVQMGVGKVQSLESLEVCGLSLAEDLLNQTRILLKRLDLVVVSSMFLSDLIRA